MGPIIKTNTKKDESIIYANSITDHTINEETV